MAGEKLLDERFHLSVEADEGIAAYDAAARRAEQRLIDRGFDFQEKPRARSQWTTDRGFPVLPPNLMDLSTHDLGTFYTIVETWQGYAAEEEARVQGELAAVREQHKLLKASIQQHDKRGSIADRQDKTLLDTRYVDINARLLEVNNLKRSLSVAHAKLDSMEKAISRIITLREQQLGAGNRSSGLRTRTSSRRVSGGEQRPVRRQPDQPKRRPGRRPPPRGSV